MERASSLGSLHWTDKLCRRRGCVNTTSSEWVAHGSRQGGCKQDDVRDEQGERRKQAEGVEDSQRQSKTRKEIMAHLAHQALHHVNGCMLVGFKTKDHIRYSVYLRYTYLPKAPDRTRLQV